MSRQVVLCCSASPKRIPQLDPGLEARVLGGQVVELKGPDRATRLEVVRARGAAKRLRLDEEVVDLLVAGRYELNVRELLGMLTHIEAHQRHTEAAHDAAAVHALIRDLVQGRLRPATLEAVADFVAERLGSDIEKLRSRSRKPSVVQARQVAMALSRELTPLTLREVGAYFGGRSCASVHFAQQRARELQDEDHRVREVWEAARRTFEESSRVQLPARSSAAPAVLPDMSARSR